MKLITLDFETFWSTDYTLSKMVCEEYVRDSRFLIHMVGVKIDDQPPVVLTREQSLEILPKMPWDKLALLGQNLQFDSFILAHHYGIIPKLYIDTMSMFRALAPHKRASLKSIAEFLNLSQAKGGQQNYSITNTKGIRHLSPEMWNACAEYCKLDCELTYEAWLQMKPHFPIEELKLIDQTLRFFAQPVLILNPEPLAEEVKFEAEKKAELIARIGGDVKVLGSSPKFALLLEELGVVPPVKPSPSALKKDPDLKDALEALDLPQEAYTPALLTEAGIPWSYAFGKNDKGLLALQQHDDPMVVAAVEARLGVKSTLAGTRAARLLSASARGAYPVSLNYSAAHTHRWGGCVAATTEVIINRHGVVTPCAIIFVEPADLVWDGEEFVTHEGVEFRGEQNIICWGGIIGTPEHIVYVDDPLGENFMPLQHAQTFKIPLRSGLWPEQLHDLEALVEEGDGYLWERGVYRGPDWMDIDPKFPVSTPVYDIVNCGPRHRFWANGKIIHNSGGCNVQNLPGNKPGQSTRLREAFTAPPGYLLVVCDLAGIEARGLAYLAGEQSILNLVGSGGDLYCDLASAIFQMTVTKKENPNERAVGKMGVLSGGYSMAWKTFQEKMYLVEKILFGREMADRLGVSVGPLLAKHSRYISLAKPQTLTPDVFAVHCAVSEFLIKTYRDKYPAITRFWRTCIESLNWMMSDTEFSLDPHGAVKTFHTGFRAPWGHDLRYIELESKSKKNGKQVQWTRASKEGRSHLHPGLVAENVTQWLCRHILAYQALQLQAEGLKIAFTCHDEIVGVARIEDAPYWERRMEQVMSADIPWLPGLPLGSEAHTGRTYKEAK